MFTPQSRNGPPGVPMQGQGQAQLMQSQNDVLAKEKLSTLIYEYLHISGATKTAEVFKEEVMNSNPNLMNQKPPEKGMSFLMEWWLLFYDLYCAAPERRDTNEGPYTQDAKYYHDAVIGPMIPPSMNGHFVPGMGMGPDMMGGHPGFPGRFPGRMAPGGMPPGGFGMFPDPRMPRMPGNTMRMPPGGPFPVAAPVGPMRAGPGPMPVMTRFNDFLGGPPQGFNAGAVGAAGMVPNGSGIPPMSMSSPGMPPPGADPTAVPPFMGMPGSIPASSSGMQFGMNDQAIPTTASAGTPGAPSSASADTPTTASGMPSSVPGMPSSVGAPTSLVNGEEIKNSPASTPRGGNGATGGTPAPGSVQSAAAGQPLTPLAGPLSQPPLSVGAVSTSNDKDEGEISKIKEGLLDGFDSKLPTSEFNYS